MTLTVSVAAVLTMSFWISGDVNFKSSGAFSNVIALNHHCDLTENAIMQESYFDCLNF